MLYFLGKNCILEAIYAAGYLIKILGCGNFSSGHFKVNRRNIKKVIEDKANPHRRHGGLQTIPREFSRSRSDPYYQSETGSVGYSSQYDRGEGDTRSYYGSDYPSDLQSVGTGIYSLTGYWFLFERL